MNDLISRQAAIDTVNTALFPKINTAKDAEKALMALPSAQPEIIRCKDCKHRGVVNECPFAKYAIFKNGFRATSVIYSYTMNDSPTRVEVLCPVPDDGYCYKGERTDDE